jgi:Fe-S oxidoreductase
LAEARSGKDLKDLALDTRVYMCVDCSKCTGACPIGIAGEIYSPRAVVQHALLDGREPVLHEVWRCLTCGICKVRCPSDVDYPEFVRGLRENAIERQLLPQHTHGGVIRELMRIMSRHPGRQKRTDWVPGWVEVLGPENESGSAEDVYFVGCAPYFDVVFKDFNLDMVGTHIAALDLLRAAGVKPAVLADEVCCGHDALWSGDRDLFAALARRNAAALERVGARRVFISCPEGYHTLLTRYGEFFGNRKVEVINTVAFLSANAGAIRFGAAPTASRVITAGGLGDDAWESGQAGRQSMGRDYVAESSGQEEAERAEFALESARPAGMDERERRAAGKTAGEAVEVVTLHDPCRMGRFAGLYEEPRSLIEKVGGVELREMEFSRDASPCCGSNLWINCDHLSKKLQSGLIAAAAATGAGTLLTSCDKCRIHLACASMVMGELKPEIETRNILAFLNERR